MSTVDYNTWNTKFTGQCNLIVRTSLKVMYEACDVLYDRIVNRTPVGNPSLWEPPYWPRGYTPGHLKANWQIKQEGDTVTIWNDAPYAYRIETGWSTKQAPEGMMRVSLKEFNAILLQVQSKYKL